MANPAAPPTTPPSVVDGPIELRLVSELREHARAGLLPAVTAKAYRTLCVDVERRGLQLPLEVTAAGVVLDGHVRLAALAEVAPPRRDVRPRR